MRAESDYWEQFTPASGHLLEAPSADFKWVNPFPEAS